MLTYAPLRPWSAKRSGIVALATRQELSEFLAGAERRAYKQALYAVRNEESALDIVQDAMMRLAQSYAERPAEEWPMLFQRIVQNAIRDFFRRQKARSGVITPLSNLSSRDEDEDDDPLDRIEIDEISLDLENPELQLSRSEVLQRIEIALADLPARQREAFVLRYWEELDVAETAAVMGCSEGSVKTHCSRATHALAAALQAQGLKA